MSFPYEIKRLDFTPDEFKLLKNKPQNIFYTGNKELLKKRKISIVGSRRALSYTKEITTKIATQFKKLDFVVVSGGAMGVDAIAHSAAFPNTICILANSLDFFYPAVNQKLLSKIYTQALAISEYEKDFKARKYTFVQRNRLVVALGEFLIVTQADENSGTLTSIKYALEMGKKVYVIPHRINQSLGTQKLIQEGKVEVIYDLDTFFSQFSNNLNTFEDEVIKFCSNNPSFEEAVEKFGSKIYEYELEGKIFIKDLKVYVT